MHYFSIFYFDTCAWYNAGSMCTKYMCVCVFVCMLQEHFLTDALLREVVERMGKDLADAADNYLDFPDNSRLPVLGARSHKDLETEEQLFPIDYDSLGEANPNPSIRDQEYLEHSSLWGKRYLTFTSDKH